MASLAWGATAAILARESYAMGRRHLEAAQVKCQQGPRQGEGEHQSRGLAARRDIDHPDEPWQRQGQGQVAGKKYST